MRKCEECKDYTSNPKFCSRSCAARANNRGVNRHKTGKRQGPMPHCLVCDKRLPRRSRKYCSSECQIKERHAKYITAWLAEEVDGLQASGLVSGHVRRWMEESRGKACELCHKTVWSNDVYSGPIPLEADHIDGNWKNNRPENLRLLCPNCHNLTPTYRGKNRGNGREFRKGGRGNNL